MHRQLYAHCHIELKISAVSPLLVQGEQADRGDATFFRAIDPRDKIEKYCIPATSLKGVWRSAAERILRTVEADLACDPFAESAGSTQSCSKRLEDKQYDTVRDTGKVYALLCPVCRLFGSTAHAGLLTIGDGWIAPAQPVEKRTGIAIDRFTGGVKQGALYTLAPLAPGSTFTISVEIPNVEFWHLGLLALVCREMDEGRVRLGSGTNKGLGHAQIAWQSVRFRYPAQKYAAAQANIPDALASSQAFSTGNDRIGYAADEEWLLTGIRPQQSAGWKDAPWTTFLITDGDLDALRRACVEKALAPKLEKGRAGFAYPEPKGEK